MSNPNSENPDSPETSNPTANEDELSPSEQPATVVEMSSAQRTSEGSATTTTDSSDAERSESIREAADDPLRNSPTPAKPSRKLMIALLVLLLISVAINVMQAQQQRRTDVQSAELDLALDRAMERIDDETIRANDAEGTLSEIDRNVDNVQERIADLQSALSELSTATAR